MIGFGQMGSIISLNVSPTYPIETDTVYIYAELAFGYSSCPLNVKSYGISGNNIVASTQHCLGMLSAICYNTDTFKINPLSTGTYTFDLTLSSGFGGSPCTAGIVPDDYDTIRFYVSTLTLGQQTYVPDNNFEAYLENNGMGDGIAFNDSVFTSAIDTLTYLDVSMGAGSATGIFDLTGIEDFTALTTLYCYSNQLTTLDVSQNTALTYLNCNNNQLTSLDVSNNTALTSLSCYLNHLTSLDVSSNTVLTTFNCFDNQLTSLDVRNGNNTNMSFAIYNNPNLNCINVDDMAWSTANWTVANGIIDSQHYFDNNCLSSAIQEHNTSKELLKIIDVLGRETKGTKNEPLFYIYDDGTVEKRIVIE